LRNRRLSKDTIVITVALFLIVVIFSLGPIAQDPGYHVFADTRAIRGIPSAMNVMSNLAFVFTGAWGVAVALQHFRKNADKTLLRQYLLFFGGVFLSGVGSMYYHFDPTNSSLVWDRLPMSVAVMALLSSAVSEMVDKTLGSVLLIPLSAAGVLSVLFWAWTEQAGGGDLRPYIAVQFLPVLLIPLMLVLYRPEKAYAFAIWFLAGMYVLAKVFEVLDQQVFAVSGISGHTIKHVVAAIGTAAVVRMLSARSLSAKRLAK
jgi:hypothetical protein